MGHLQLALRDAHLGEALYDVVVQGAVCLSDLYRGCFTRLEQLLDILNLYHVVVGAVRARRDTDEVQLVVEKVFAEAAFRLAI